MYLPIPFIIKKHLEMSFCLACRHSQFEVAKWLLQCKPNLDISYNNTDLSINVKIERGDY